MAGVGDCRLSEGGPMDRLAKMFALNRAGLNVKRGAVVFGGMLVPFVVLTALDQKQYFLPAAFATLFAAMCDPGGEYRTRVQMMAGMAVAGALLTGLGFAVGARGWGLVVLAAFVVTLAAGLMVKFGGHRFFAAVLLNVWFIVALGLPTLFHLNRVTVHCLVTGAGLADHFSILDRDYLRPMAD